MQETWIQTLIQEDLTRGRATKPITSQFRNDAERENLQMSKHVLCLKGLFFQRCQDENYFSKY